MKLDKWPETIECEGWMWRFCTTEAAFTKTGIDKREIRFVKWEKIHVPPTMREIMEHLLKGGWVRYGVTTYAYYYKLDESGQLKVCINSRTKEWINKTDIPNVAQLNAQFWFLIQPNDWIEGVEK